MKRRSARDLHQGLRAAIRGAFGRVFLIAAVVVTCAAVQWLFTTQGAAQTSPRQSRSLPVFEVDPAWPKVPAKWKLGDPSSIAIDAQDNVWVLHRPRTLKPERRRWLRRRSSCSTPPATSSRPGAATAAATSGRSASTASTSTHKGFVWLGGNNCPTNGIAGLKPVADDQMLKFTQDGKFVLQIGQQQSEQGQRRHAEPASRRPTSGCIRRPTSCSSPTATAITASPCSMPTTAPSSGCGARSATSRWTTTTARW